MQVVNSEPLTTRDPNRYRRLSAPAYAIGICGVLNAHILISFFIYDSNYPLATTTYLIMSVVPVALWPLVLDSALRLWKEGSKFKHHSRTESRSQLAAKVVAWAVIVTCVFGSVGVWGAAPAVLGFIINDTEIFRAWILKFTSEIV